jgi:hypothetical protein
VDAIKHAERDANPRRRASELGGIGKGAHGTGRVGAGPLFVGAELEEGDDIPGELGLGP